ncbi:response regulator transcription factor [Plantactinospora endophytica]|uniref:DNA-binding response regulator n=1 Tax=Plantactinospora endophytica TaxID=673535 RepID=A0ABQ4E7P5_9ACTN|nr:response regulator transcription factor [Plantactinospora endophytica]GIG90746.1 DNA-binding response regulator [Plantactinospora endophytica]
MGSSGNTITVLICDGLAVVNAGIRALLDQVATIRVVGETSNAVQAVSLAARLRPDVAIVDSDLPPWGCAEVIRRIAQNGNGHAPKVIVTYTPTSIDPVPALSAGARAVVPKGDIIGYLAQLIQVVEGADGVFLPAGLATRLRLLTSQPDVVPERTPELLSRLTPREREVLLMVARGRNTRRIAAELGVSEATVRTHMHHVLHKLNLQDRAQAVVYAYQAGLVGGVDGTGTPSPPTAGPLPAP